MCHHNSLMYFTSIILPSWPAAAHTHTNSSTVATVAHRHRLLKCPITKRFVPSRGANQLDSLLMSLGLLMSSSPLTMWAYTNTTQRSVASGSTFVPHQSPLTTNQSLRETRNLTLVWCNSSTFHLHMIGIISAQRAVSISTVIHWHYCVRNSPATVLAKSRKPLQEVCHYPHTVGKSISTSERKTTQTSRLKCFRGNSADVRRIYK